jgi:hypothetical protein
MHHPIQMKPADSENRNGEYSLHLKEIYYRSTRREEKIAATTDDDLQKLVSARSLPAWHGETWKK